MKVGTGQIVAACRVGLGLGAALLASTLSGSAQQSACGQVMTRARTLAERFQMVQAEQELREAGQRGCDVRAATAYLRGLQAAREASAKGGDDESLAPVRRAVADLDAMGDAGGPAEIAGLVLRAAAAAAQSEREEMAVVLAQALQVERARGARGLDGAPVLSAHQMAGELWLQVHRYDEAAAAFLVARGVAGDSPRVSVGLARARARDGRIPEACDASRAVERLAPDVRAVMKAEVAEAQEFLRQPACRQTTRR
jgi:tetratricopeptide (TPR) repeat protein